MKHFSTPISTQSIVQHLYNDLNQTERLIFESDFISSPSLQTEYLSLRRLIQQVDALPQEQVSTKRLNFILQYAQSSTRSVV